MAKNEKLVTEAQDRSSMIKKFVRRTVERLGYRYFKIPYQPVGLDHAHDVGRFLRSARHVKVVFDVGANEGQTAEHYVRAFPCAQIYSFEPVATTYKSLTERVSGWPRVRTFQLALADRNRSARTQLVSISGLNSLRNELSDSSSSSCGELVTIKTLESFCAEQNIDHIDLLKTDTEGFELEALKGTEAMLRARQIQFILAEVTFDPENTCHTPFFHLAEYLHGFGYYFLDIYDDDNGPFSRPPPGSCNALFSCVQKGLINVPAVAFRGG
jgi:FkbM family methyltransferase